MKEHKIQIRGGFSDRNGINPVNKQIQHKDFDMRTRNAICNMIYDWVYYDKYGDTRKYFLKDIICDAFAECFGPDLECYIDSNPDRYYNSYIVNSIINSEFDDVLTLVEYIANYYTLNYPTRFSSNWGDYLHDFRGEVNNLFEKEYVGYRFVGEQIVAITDTEEIKAIEETLGSRFQGCKAHISKALSLISNRDNPDYKNSIKESISAVESVCQIITGDKKATLGEAIKLLEKNGIKIHPALQEAFKKIYGYTSDEGGIRHAEGMFESNVTFDDAKYMLVSCCAFVNYLIPKYDDIKRKLQ